MKKETRGGKRKGSGRKKGPVTKVLSFRVKIEHEPPIRAAVKKIVKK